MFREKCVKINGVIEQSTTRSAYSIFNEPTTKPRPEDNYNK